MVFGCKPFRLRCLRWVWYCWSKCAVDTGAAVDAVMVAFPREWLHNQSLESRGVKVQNNSRDRRLGFLRVAASSNRSLKRIGQSCALSVR